MVSSTNIGQIKSSGESRVSATRFRIPDCRSLRIRIFGNMVLTIAIASLINSLIGMMPARTIIMPITKRSAAARGLSAGSPVWVSFKADAVHAGEFLYRMSFDLSNMEREELCPDRCGGLLRPIVPARHGCSRTECEIVMHKPCTQVRGLVT